MQVQKNILSYEGVLDLIRNSHPRHTVCEPIFKTWLETSKILPVFQIKHAVAKQMLKNDKSVYQWQRDNTHWRTASFFGWATDYRLKQLFHSLTISSVSINQAELLEALSPFEWHDMLYSDESQQIVLTGPFFPVWSFVDHFSLVDAQNQLINWRERDSFATPPTSILNLFDKSFTPVTVHKSEIYFVVLDSLSPAPIDIEKATPSVTVMDATPDRTTHPQMKTHAKRVDPRLLSSCQMLINTLSHMTNSNPIAVCKTYDPNDISSYHQLIDQLLELSAIDITEVHSAAAKIEAHATLNRIKTRGAQKIAELIKEVKSIKNNH